MAEIKFRILRHDEVELRVNQVTEKGFSLLLYKDARCDMNILDETVGPFGWKREHDQINGKEFARVSIFDKALGEWVWKEDCGTESNTQKEKGESSDAFKRACVNWGIGRELYTKIFIWINDPVKDTGKKDKNGKPVYAPVNRISDYKVTQMDVDEESRKITALTIERDGNPVFVYPRKAARKADKKPAEPEPEKNPDINPEMAGELLALAAKIGQSIGSILRAYEVSSIYHLSLKQYNNAIKTLRAKEQKPEGKAS